MKVVVVGAGIGGLAAAVALSRAGHEVVVCSLNHPDEPVEVVNIRVAAVGQRVPLAFPRLEPGAAATRQRVRPVHLDDVEAPVMCPVYERDRLAPGAAFSGPAIVQEHGTTTVMFAGDRCTVAPTGELIISVSS